MTLGLMLVILIGLAVVIYLATPLLSRDALEAEERQSDSVDALRELHARQQGLLASLKDLEDDRATDKVGEEDYVALEERLSAQVIAIMRDIDRLESENRAEIEAEEAAMRPLQYPTPEQGDGPR